MPRRSSKKSSKNSSKPVNVLQANKIAIAAENISNQCRANTESDSRPIESIAPIFEDENTRPGTSKTNTAALYTELDHFRQRWRRELEGNSRYLTGHKSNNVDSDEEPVSKSTKSDENTTSSTDKKNQESQAGNPWEDPTYQKAKTLFLTAVELEKDDMHYESIRYYKQAMYLYPNIEKQLFKEQSEKKTTRQEILLDLIGKHTGEPNLIRDDNIEPLYDRIRRAQIEDYGDEAVYMCKPNHKQKGNTLHVSDLPHELMIQIICYVVGQELDTTSLENLGSVCRGFYLLSKDSLLWRSICVQVWGKRIMTEDKKQYLIHDSPISLSGDSKIDWRHMYYNRPRLNFDGVYISRTKYIRQGDTGFHDLTYRPFHVIRYYRYIRFFPGNRLLILTTNEEPDRICPIFRHAFDTSHFSPELSVMEGTYEFSDITNKLSIVAEKDCRQESPLSIRSQRRQHHFHWSRQTPLSQKFSLKFDLKTTKSRPYKNNVLKWVEYNIMSRFETGHDMTTFEIAPDTFPNLTFFRVKMTNLTTSKPLVYC